MTAPLDELPLQAFRDRSTGVVINIPTRASLKSKKRVVLWIDIKAAFEDARCIMDGDTLVPVLLDDNNKLITPRQIAYYSGVILDVVPKQTKVSVNLGQPSSPISPSSPGERTALLQDTEGPTALGTFARMSAQPIASIKPRDRPTLARFSEKAYSSVYPSNRPYSACLYAVVPVQELQTDTTKESMHRNFEQLQRAMDESKLLQQEEMTKLHKQMQQLHQQSRQVILEEQNEARQRYKSTDAKQDLILQTQQQILAETVVIHNRVQVLLVQTYELHEYPIPRLFIVLPKATRIGDKLKKPFSDQFKLHFLCECGTHTMNENTRIPHEIHLAKHGGYDLDKPNEFFEKYGTYVLAMMIAIKYGIVAAGLIVPPLTNFRMWDESAEKHIEYLNKEIGPVVDHTINYLQNLKRKNRLVETTAITDLADYGRLEALEGADLRLLESYLKVKDKGRDLGNLYRIVTSEGHVKWVCFDHYRVDYQERVIQLLRDTVEACHGSFIDKIGRIEIHIASSHQATQFYDALVKARGIQELDITLAWDATMNDLRDLSDAVTRANVFDMKINGSYFKRPTIDMVNRSQRFDPILQLASNSRIQSFCLEGFDDFFSRISKSALLPAPRLRVFSIDLSLGSKVKDPKALYNFHGFLGHCSALTTLELNFHPEHSITKSAPIILNKLHNVKQLTIRRGELLVTISVIDGVVKDLTMIIDKFNDLTQDDHHLIQQTRFRRLWVEYTHWPGGDQLAGILRNSSARNHLQFRHKGSSVTVATAIELNIRDVIKMATSENSREAQTLSIVCPNLQLDTKVSQGVFRNMALTIKKLADTSTEDLEFIKEKQIQRLTIDSTPLSSDKSRLTEILWSSNELRHLRINCDTRSSHSSTKGSEMTIQDLVTIVPSRTINQVESLEIHRGGFILATSSGTGIRNVSLKVVQLSNLNSEDLKFVQRRQLTRLEIQQFSHADKSRLADILKNCTMIVNLHIRCKVEYRRTNIIEMKLHDLVNIATSNATSKFESLTIEYDDLSMTASVLQGRLQDVKLTISKLCDLTSDAFDFMQREHLVQLSIKYTPMKDDDNQLCSIISRVPSLSQLRIGSKADRSLQLIELVMQHRSRVLQETGSCGLAEFDLMEENLVAFNPLDSHDYENHVQSQIKFYDGLHTFDMNTRIRLDRYYLSISKAIQAIISQFGWSIQFFDGGIGNHVNDFANLNSKTPYLRTLRGAIFWNSFSYVKQIIERSPRFQDLGLHLDVAASGGFEIAQELLDQYKAHLSCLLLFNGRYDERWSWFASQFPTRQSFPILESFELIPRSSYRLPSKCIPWIVAMISAAPPALDLSPQGTARREVSNDEPSVIRTWTSLKKITLEKLTLRPEEWTSVVKAIDFSMLEVLSFRKSNISVADFKLLVDRIPDGDPSTAPLKILNIRATTADGNAVAHSFFAEIHRKAPSARVCIS